MEGTHPQAGRELTHIAFTAVVYGCTMPLCEKSTCYVSTYSNVPLPEEREKRKKRQEELSRTETSRMLNRTERASSTGHKGEFGKDLHRDVPNTSD